MNGAKRPVRTLVLQLVEIEGTRQEWRRQELRCCYLGQEHSITIRSPEQDPKIAVGTIEPYVMAFLRGENVKS